LVLILFFLSYLIVNLNCSVDFCDDDAIQDFKGGNGHLAWAFHATQDVDNLRVLYDTLHGRHAISKNDLKNILFLAFLCIITQQNVFSLKIPS
jgi:hypothetical protein